MNNIPTAEEFLEEFKATRLLLTMTSNDIQEYAIKFAKLHVEAVLKTAAENTETTLWQEKDDLEIVGNRADYIINQIPIKDSIINAYPLENIK